MSLLICDRGEVAVLVIAELLCIEPRTLRRGPEVALVLKLLPAIGTRWKTLACAVSPFDALSRDQHKVEIG